MGSSGFCPRLRIYRFVASVFAALGSSLENVRSSGCTGESLDLDRSRADMATGTKPFI